MQSINPETLQKNLVTLTGDNYKEWAQKFTGLFSFLSLSSHIEMDLQCFDDPNWVESERDIKNLLASFAQEQFHQLIHESRTVAIAWNKLKEICEVPRTPYQLFELLDTFRFTDSISFGEIKRSIEQAEFMCDNLAMYKFQMGDEFHKKAKLISSLPDAFSSLKELLIGDMRNLKYEMVKEKTLEYAKELAKQQFEPQNAGSHLAKTGFPLEKPIRTDQSLASQSSDSQPSTSRPSASQQPTGHPSGDHSSAEQSSRDGLVTPSNVQIVDARSAQNFRESMESSKAPPIQDIRYMSPEELKKSFKQDPGATTPLHRRNSDSVDRPSKGYDSPRRKRSQRRVSKSRRERSRNREDRRERSRNRKEGRRSRRDSMLGNNSDFYPDISINQNKINKDLPFPKAADIEMFKSLQSFGSIGDCNRALVNGSSNKKEIASN